MDDRIRQHFATLADLIAGAAITGLDGAPVARAEAFGQIIELARTATATGGKLMFIGNGGSAGIASHVAIDWSKTGGMRAVAFNDAAALTCLGNDYGYQAVFAKQIEFHGLPGDILVAISSSGGSANILQAVEAARARGCRVLTLSGFSPDNPLRRAGDLNFHVNSMEYGFVEVAHLALIHAWLDLAKDHIPIPPP